MTLSPALDDLEAWVVECNCSICARNGYLNVYVQNDCIEFETVGLESELVEVCKLTCHVKADVLKIETEVYFR